MKTRCGDGVFSRPEAGALEGAPASLRGKPTRSAAAIKRESTLLFIRFPCALCLPRKGRQQKFEKYGWYANVDFTSDPEKVHWSAFLSDDRYKDEVGIFEGGALYSKGVWRPTQNSMMNEDAEYFNAPSRWAIYQRIMKLSGEECSFEKFLEYDKVNRGAAKASAAKAY